MPVTPLSVAEMAEKLLACEDQDADVVIRAPGVVTYALAVEETDSSASVYVLGAAVQRPGSRLDAIGRLLGHADSVEGEHGPGTGAPEAAIEALRTLGVTDVEIGAATRKAARIAGS